MNGETLKTERLSLAEFIAAMRAWAEEVMARTARVGVPVYPLARDIIRMQDDELKNSYLPGCTREGLERMFAEEEVRVRAHIRKHTVERILAEVAASKG